MANDISNLLGRFGATTNGYLEVEDTLDYKEPPKKPVAKVIMAPVAPVAPVTTKAPVAAVTAAVKPEPVASLPVAPALTAAPAAIPLPVSTIAPVAPVAPRLDERIEPVIGDVPVMAEAVHATLPASATAPSAMPTPAPVMASSLRTMLGEAALKREAEERARNDKAARQAALNNLRPVTPATVIALVSPKGGVGKTTLCAALAGMLSRHARTIAIDLDPQNALQFHLGVAADEVATAATGLAGGNWGTLLREGVGGTKMVPFGAMTEPQRQALEQEMQEDRHWLARQLARMNLAAGDIVILDTPGGRSPYLTQALDAAGQLVVVLTPDAGAFMALDGMADLFAQHGSCSYVINQFDATRTFSQDMVAVLRHRFGASLLGVTPLDYDISEGLAYGVNPLLQGEPSALAQEVEAIAGALAVQVQSNTVLGSRA